MAVVYIDGYTDLKSLELQANTTYLLTQDVVYTNTSGFKIADHSAIFDGQGHTVHIENAVGFTGLFRGGCSIRNLTIDGTSSTLAAGAGWMFISRAENPVATECKILGNIGSNGGGIAGAFTVGAQISYCSSTGYIGSGGGGLLGSNCRDCELDRCYSEGTVALNAGGLVGSNAFNSDVTNSYSHGFLVGGGIFGQNARRCTATNSYASGSGLAEAGGIFDVSSTNCLATECYVSGVSTIFGLPAASNVTNGCFAESEGVWKDARAIPIMYHEKKIWFIPGANQPWRLISVLPECKTVRVCAPTCTELLTDRKPCMSCDKKRTYSSNSERLRDMRYAIRMASSQKCDPTLL